MPARAAMSAENGLRRIGADLHDGPAQYLAYASLRVDALGRALDHPPDELTALREAWATLQNDALADAGSAARVDHRTLAAQREAELKKAQQAQEAGRPVEAQVHQRQAQRLDREPRPYLPFLVFKRMVREVAEHIRQRLGQWSAGRLRDRAFAHLAAMEQAGPSKMEERIAGYLGRAAHAFGLERWVEPLIPRGPAHER